MISVVKLKDGTQFVGDRPWWYSLSEGWGEFKFKVLESETLTRGSIIRVPMASISYRLKGK